jgi:hypothetical protein
VSGYRRRHRRTGRVLGRRQQSAGSCYRHMAKVDVRYAYAKLGETTQILTTQPSRVKERLTEAINRRGWATLDPGALEVEDMDRDAQSITVVSRTPLPPLAYQRLNTTTRAGPY